MKSLTFALDFYGWSVGLWNVLSDRNAFTWWFWPPDYWIILLMKGCKCQFWLPEKPMTGGICLIFGRVWRLKIHLVDGMLLIFSKNSWYQRLIIIKVSIINYSHECNSFQWILWNLLGIMETEGFWRLYFLEKLYFFSGSQKVATNETWKLGYCVISEGSLMGTVPSISSLANFG